MTVPFVRLSGSVVPGAPVRSRRRRSVVLKSALGALALGLLTACGDASLELSDSYGYTDGLSGACPAIAAPGIVIDFVSSLDGAPVAVSARGTVTDAFGRIEDMVSWDSPEPLDGRTTSLAGAFNRSGNFTVDIDVPEVSYQFSRSVSVGSSDGCLPDARVIALPLAL